MDIDALRASLGESRPPDEVTPLVRALWHDARGEWEQAHAIAQTIGDADGSWVHGYLHRVEGDLANAAYWYRRAGRPAPEMTLAEEWSDIAATLLARDG